MYICLRIDLDYVPWDTPDAQEFGHGEPAVFLRLLDIARSSGYKFHFFASNRVLRAFPSVADAILNEGHDLDWFCKHPEEPGRKVEAFTLFKGVGHVPLGLGIKGSWPADGSLETLSGFQFISAGPSAIPSPIRHFPVETRAVREAYRSGASLKTWTDSLKAQIRDYASRNLGLTVAVRPQVLGRYDARLSHLKEILDLARAVGLEVHTLRDLL